MSFTFFQWYNLLAPVVQTLKSAIQCLNNQGLMSKVKKRAWKCIEIKATGTLYTALWCSPCVWMPYTAFPLSQKIKDSQVNFHVHSSNIIHPYWLILDNLNGLLTFQWHCWRADQWHQRCIDLQALPPLSSLIRLSLPLSHYLPFFPTKKPSSIIFTQSLVNDPLIWDVTLFSIL